jgi:hypothetical protein
MHNQGLTAYAVRRLFKPLVFLLTSPAKYAEIITYSDFLFTE